MTSGKRAYSTSTDDTAATAAPSGNRPYPELPAAADSSGEAGHTAAAGCIATQHGTASAYKNHGCRCDTARRAHVRYQKQWNYDRDHRRPRRVPSIGAQRRVQALMTMGWDLGTLAAHIGRRQLNIGHRPVISAHLHRRICLLFDELSPRRGPSAQAAAYAERRGWLPPLAWDDDTIDDPEFIAGNIQSADDFTNSAVDPVAIERRLDGDASVHLTRVERKHALEQLVRCGYSISAAAQRLGINGTYARRYAAELGLSVRTTSNDAAITDDFKETG